jgi:hypothetical protein
MQSQWRPIFEDVVAIGRGGLTPKLAAAFHGKSDAVRIKAGECDELLASRPEADGWDLVRGLVTLEEQLGWGDGSVAAGNLLARAFVQRFPHRWAEAVTWLKENAKTNSWYFTKHSPLSFSSEGQWKAFLEAEQRREG